MVLSAAGPGEVGVAHLSHPLAAWLDAAYATARKVAPKGVPRYYKQLKKGCQQFFGYLHIRAGFP